MRYDAPKGTHVSTTLSDGSEIRVERFPADVVDEELARELDRLVADKKNPLKHARPTKDKE